MEILNFRTCMVLQALCEVKYGDDVTSVSHLNHQLSEAVYKISKISTLRLREIAKLVTKPYL